MPIPIAPILILAGVSAFLLQRKKSKCPAGHMGGELDDVVYKEIVTGGADPNETLPMIIAFHGKGAKPDDLLPKMTLFRQKVRVILPQGIIKEGDHYYWWKRGAKDPDQDALAFSMEATVRILEDFIREIPQCRPTIGKPIVAGHSQGGMLSFALATIHPELVSAAVPASGWLPEKLWSTNTAPIYAIHGQGDEIVPFAWTADYIAKMRQQGAEQIFLRAVPGGHPLGSNLLTKWLDIMRYTLRKGTKEWEKFGHPFG